MAHYVGTIRTDRTVEQAFDYLADFSSVREWDPTAVSAENLSGRVGVGAKFRVVVRPKRLVLRAESPAVVSLDTITFTATEAGAEVTYDARLEPKGAMKLAAPVLALLFKRLGDNAARGLERELNEEET